MKMKDLRRYNDQRVTLFTNHSHETGELVIKNRKAYLLDKKDDEIGWDNEVNLHAIEDVVPFKKSKCPDGYDYVKHHYSNGHYVKAYCRKKVR